MSYKYFLYGLNVESEIEIEEAYKQDFDTEPDVRIVIGEVPDQVKELDSYKNNEFFFATSSNGLVFRIPGTGEYWATKDKITVKPFEGAAHSYVKCFILGSSFGYCMLLRKQVVMHGGAVSRYGKGIIVTGESGAGKSTVTDSLLSDGYQFIADDVCALTENDGKSHINMAYPQQKLCRDAALNKGYDLSELIYINEDRDKFALRLKDGYLKDGADFDYLFELVLSEDDKLSMRKISGHEKLNLLMRNVYRGVDGFRIWGVPVEYMQMLLKVASTVEIYQISRPKNLDTLPEIVSFIDEVVSGKYSAI